MANGREPSCVTCAHFKLEHQPGTTSPVVRDPTNSCICTLHNVLLPFSETTELLICRDWKDKKTGDLLVNWPAERKYKPGILYAYDSIYAPALTEFRKLGELPKP
jgi:hypothetical protein